MGYESRYVANARSNRGPLVVGCRLRDCHDEASRWPLLEVFLGSKDSRQHNMHGVLGVLHPFPYIC